jgi:hypothetical protein
MEQAEFCGREETGTTDVCSADRPVIPYQSWDISIQNAELCVNT